MPVEIDARVSGFDGARMCGAAECALEALGRAHDEVSIAVVDDADMRTLNRQWRNKDSTTDVLSFSQLEGENPPMKGVPAELGDIVISLETAARQAEDGGWSLEEELNRLMVHGLLHVLGHDHECGGERERAMQAEERRIAQVLRAAGHGCAGL